MSDILFLSTRDGCLNRLAEILAGEIAPHAFRVVGAGIGEAGLDDALTQRLSEQGFTVDTGGKKTLGELQDRRFDVVVTLTVPARTQCPILPGVPVMIHWDIADPGEDSDCDPEALPRTISLLRERINALFSPGILASLIAQKQTFDAILAGLPVGIMAHDMHRRIFYLSPRAEKITGLRQSDVLGKDCHEVFSPAFCGSRCQLPGAASASSIESCRYGTVLLDGGGVSGDLDISVVPLRDEDGVTIGALASIDDKTDLRRLERRLQAVAQFSGIIGQDHKMQQVYDLIRDVGPSDFPVVISGESGTGKELAANAIHQHSHRRDKPFITINCGALPEGTLESELFGHVRGSFTGAFRDKKGRFELADGGTIFLDEVGELSATIQVKLLRVLQEGTFEPVGSEASRKSDVRIISATNRNLKDLVAKGKFREDLFYRLAVVPVELPPLRERKNDIPLLVEHFLRSVSGKLNRGDVTISPHTLSRLVEYSWPGNVRQLQNAIQYALVKCHGRVILPEHLPVEIVPFAALLGTEELHGREGKVGRRPKLSVQSVRAAFDKTGGNKAKAARMLGVGRATLYNFIKEHGGEIPVV